MTIKAPRETGIELARIYCCFCVIAIHLTSFYSNIHMVSLLWSIAKCAATPVFFLIAGFFFSADKPFSMYIRRILGRVIIPTIFIMLLIAQLTPWLSGQDSLANSLNKPNFYNYFLVFKILVSTWPYNYLPGYNPFISLWFTFALFLCYLCFPVLKMICADNQKAKQLKRYLLWLGLIFFVFRVSLVTFFPDNFTIQHLDWWIEEKPFYWLWLMMVGHHFAIYLKDPSFMAKWRTRLTLVSLPTYLFGGVILYWLTMNYNIDEDGLVDQRFFVREFFFYLTAQLGMFVFFVSLNLGHGLVSRLILFVADKCFYIYMIHEAVYHKLMTLTEYDLSRVSCYLELAIITFCICLFLATLFKKIERLIAALVSSNSKIRPLNNLS